MNHEASGLHSWLRVARKRKWIILMVLVVLPVATVYLSLQKPPLYRASAEVLLNRQNLAASLNGIPDQSAFQDPARLAQTQADLAQAPEVAERVLRAVGSTDRTPNEFLSASSVAAKPGADLLDFSVTDRSPKVAARLASEYAYQFTVYRRELDTTVLVLTRKGVESRIDRLRSAGDVKSPLYTSLVDKEQQLRTLEALQSSNTLLARSADTATQVQPRPLRDGLLALVLALLLGVGLAFLSETLDTRIRSADELAAGLGLPLLARLQEPQRRLRNKNRLVMRADLQSAQAEAFRIFRTNLEFANLERGARTIMVTSAAEQEGKTTTVANLGVALAHAGRRVVLVDLDLRRPLMHRFFDLPASPGLTDVALGHIEIEEAIRSIAITGPKLKRQSVNENGRGRDVAASLEVITSGPLPPNPGEFAGSRVLGQILNQLRERSDLVLIDAPPLLHVGDAMVLGGRVEALFVVARLNLIRRPTVRELERALERCPADKLGFVVTGADADVDYEYSSYYYSHDRPQRRTEHKPVA